MTITGKLESALIDEGITKEVASELVHEILSKYDNDEERICGVINRIKSGEPIAYIVGHQPFYKEDYIVNSNVLIPRPDTELLVEAAIRFCKSCDFPMGDISIVPEGSMNKGDGLWMADFCTGSGCVGISVINALADKGYDVTAYLTDISSEALKVCNMNVQGQLSEISKEVSSVKVINCDIFDEVKMTRLIPHGNLDFIVSNPPYITSSDMKELDKSVSDFEPETALWGGEDGLNFYRILAKYGQIFLKKGGAILMEHGYDQGDSVKALMTDYGYSNVITLKDFGGNARGCVAIK